MRELGKYKKDVLNCMISILLMFLVGSCMMMVMIVETNPKKEKIRSSSNNDVVNNNQTRTGVKILDTNNVMHTKHKQKEPSDTTEQKRGSK
ncbi:MAG: hypothetical protein [Microviridae sp.]|nr:MAG: hypothetical protein [Microviridae sp.]